MKLRAGNEDPLTWLNNYVKELNEKYKEDSLSVIIQKNPNKIIDKNCRYETHMSSISEHLRRRIRCIIWKQWKTCEHRYKCLLKLGVSKEKAWRTSYSKEVIGITLCL